MSMKTVQELLDSIEHNDAAALEFEVWTTKGDGPLEVAAAYVEDGIFCIDIEAQA